MKQTFEAQAKVIDSLTRVALAHPDSKVLLRLPTVGDAAKLIEVAIVKHQIPLQVFSDAGLLVG